MVLPLPFSNPVLHRFPQYPGVLKQELATLGNEDSLDEGYKSNFIIIGIGGKFTIENVFSSDTNGGGKNKQSK